MFECRYNHVDNDTSCHCEKEYVSYSVVSPTMSSSLRPKQSRYSPDTFVRCGRNILRRHDIIRNDVFERRWKATFGATPEICSELWDMCDPLNNMPNGVMPLHLLWALMFLKLYLPENVNAQMAGGVDEKTFRKWAGLFVELISYQESRVVSSNFFSLVHLSV